MSAADMKWDEGVNVKNYILDYRNIIDILIQGHPECLRSKTADLLFLEQLEQAIHIYFTGNDEPFAFDRGLVESALKRLPSAVIDKPMAVEFLKLYLDARGDCVYLQFISETAGDCCDSYMALNNRANAKAALGRLEEALEDFNLACEKVHDSGLPYDATPFIGRAGLYCELGRRGEALKEAEYIFDMLSDHSHSNYFEHIDLARLFLKCNAPYKSLDCLKRAMRLLAEMLPFTFPGLEGSLEYERDGEHIFALDYYLEETIGLIKQIELPPGQDKHFTALTEALKDDIALWRAKAGI